MTGEPKYSVIEDLGDGVEIREYEEQVWVVAVSSCADQAFMRLFSYFSGANLGEVKIAVISPAISWTTNTGVSMAFVLAEGFDVNKAPAPLNKDMEIRPVEKRKLATISFSGYTSPEDYERNLSILSNKLRKRNIKTANGPLLLQYDDPDTLPLDRRNEIAYVILMQE